jgi:hypothetical protein
MNRYDLLNQAIKEIEVEKLDFDNQNTDPIIKETEKSQVFSWIRLYLKEENTNLQNGDQIKIQWENEEVLTTFIGYNKKGLNKDNDGIVNADLEEDKSGLILMIDETEYRDPKISAKNPFIRTLFKISPYFEYQVYRREDLKFINLRTNESYEYVDVDM